MKSWKLKIQLITEEFFQFSLATYLLLLFAEFLKEGIVSSFFNLTILFVVVLVSGFILCLLHNEKVTNHISTPKVTKRDKIYIIFLAFGGSFLVYYQTQYLGDVALLISCITGLIIIFLSFLLLTDNHTP